MASRVGRVLQDRTNIVDSSSGASVGRKGGISKTPKKGVRGGGRTPLGDVSNSLKPSANKGVPSKFSFVENANQTVAGKKKEQDGARRKALSDISNAGKPPLKEEARKNLSTKLSVVAEEPEDFDFSQEGFLHNHEECIKASQEGFLHNHEECIKANAGAMKMDQILKILGLDNPPPNDWKIPRANPEEAKVEVMDFPLLPEEPEMEIGSPQQASSSYNLCSPPDTPWSPNPCFEFDDPKLIESPTYSPTSSSMASSALLHQRI